MMSRIDRILASSQAYFISLTHRPFTSLYSRPFSSLPSTPSSSLPSEGVVPLSDLENIVNEKHNNTRKYNSYKSHLFNGINILITNRHKYSLEDLQKNIETHMVSEYEQSVLNKPNMVGNLDLSKIDKKVSKAILDSMPMINTYIDNLRAVLSLEKDQPMRYKNLIIRHLDNDYLISMLITQFLLVLTYADCNTFNQKFVSYISASITIGKKLEKMCLYNLKTLDESQEGKTLRQSDWEDWWFELDDQEWTHKYHNNDQFYCELGTKLLEILESCELVGKKLYRSLEVKNQTSYVLAVLDKKLIDKTNHKIYAIPGSLPMVVPPKSHDEKNLGGYLLNNVVYNQRLITKKPTLYENSIIEKENKIYDVVNRVSQIGFKVNKELLDFIINNKRLNLLLDEKSLPYINKERLTRIEKTKYVSTKSKLLSQETILEIANLYKDFDDIYFPVKLDYRGRLYCIPAFFNYQSEELAKSLLLFSKPGIIPKSDNASIIYMKAYGANSFGGPISKKTLEDKSKWVDNNIEDIINYDNGVLLSKASDKLLFLSFCIEYNKYINHLNDEEQMEFKTYLPIQLDATCNGFQHLALLSNEDTLFKELNLTTSDPNEIPGDFYNFLLHKLYETLKYKIDNEPSDPDIESYKRLNSVIWERSNIKQVVMTLPYNAKKPTTRDYIIEKLTWESYDSSTKLNWYSAGKDTTTLINSIDVKVLDDVLRVIVFDDFEKIKNLCKYLKTVAQLCNRLEIPIIWSLPSGITVMQSYALTQTTSITPFERSKIRLNISKIVEGRYDKRKQSRSLMPNLIHSLDASSMTLMYDLFSRYYEKPQFFSIHDCFATTTDKVFVMKTMLTSVYTSIYTESNYLSEFDKTILDYIENNTDYKLNRVKRTVKEGKYTWRLHDINWVLNKKLVDRNTIKAIDAQYIMI